MSDLTGLKDCDSNEIEYESREFDECLLENAMYEIKTSSTYLGTDSAHRYKISGRFNDFDLAKGNNELKIKAIYSSRDSGFYYFQLMSIKFVQNLNDAETPTINFTEEYSD